jgi:GNAT superfamily N-acetyltransferase
VHEFQDYAKQNTMKNRFPTYRRAGLQDIDAMSKIRLAVKENTLSSPGKVTRKMYEDYLELLGRGWVAEVDGHLAGFCYANRTDSSIWALFLSQEYEGQGIARQLLNLATSWLFAEGNERVHLSTGIKTRADRFYAAQGWTRERVDGNDVFYSLGRLSSSDPIR